MKNKEIKVFSMTLEKYKNSHQKLKQEDLYKKLENIQLSPYMMRELMSLIEY